MVLASNEAIGGGDQQGRAAKDATLELRQSEPVAVPKQAGRRRVIDGRTKEAKRRKQMRADLIKHMGGNPSLPEMMLIDQAVELTARLATMDAKFIETGTFGQYDQNCYLAWSNTLRRTLGAIGLKGAAQKPPSLADHLAAKRGDA